jgi:hypothetical protein
MMKLDPLTQPHVYYATMRFTSILLVAFELSMFTAAQQSGDTSSNPQAAAPQMTTPSPASSSSDCAALSAGDPGMASLANSV